MSQSSRIKPLPLGKTIIYGLVPAVLLYITHYYLIPGYVERTVAPYFKNYLVGYTITMGFFFITPPCSHTVVKETPSAGMH